MTQIQPSEVQFYLSAPSASSGFTAVGTAGSSLGRYMSATQVSVSLDNLFLDLSPSQNASDQVDYQCVFVMNNTSSGLTARAPFVWMPLVLYASGGAQMAVAVDPTGAMPYTSSTQQALVIANSLVPPAGISQWHAPSSSYNPGGVALPALPPGYACAVWVQRTATGSPPITPQTFSLQCTFLSDA